MLQGRPAPELAAEVEKLAAAKMGQGELSPEEARRIERLELLMGSDDLQISDSTLEKLRQLCQLWDVDLRPAEVKSHRPVIGPVIVAAKRLIYPVLRAFLRNSIKQQQEFNATVISLLSEVCRKGRL